MNRIKFIRGLESNYSQSTYIDSLYFATDTKKIFLNGESYSGTDLGIAENKVIKDITYNASNNSLLIVYTDTTSKTITLPFVTTIEFQQALRIGSNVFRGTKQQFDNDPNKDSYFLALIIA